MIGIRRFILSTCLELFIIIAITDNLITDFTLGRMEQIEINYLSPKSINTAEETASGKCQETIPPP